MKNDRKIKILSIVALVLAITGMSLGFAAFSSTLTISSSATVTPNSDDFKFIFSGSSTDTTTLSIVPVVTGGATANNAVVSDNSVTGLNASFTEPGQSVSFTGYGHNVGKYVTYFTRVNFNNIPGETVNKKCVAVGDTTQSLVDAACESIILTYITSIPRYYPARGTFTNSSSISNYNDVQVGEYSVGEVVIEYKADGARADGPFNVQFGDIEIIMKSTN